MRVAFENDVNAGSQVDGSIDRWQPGQIEAREARVVLFGFGPAVEQAV